MTTIEATSATISSNPTAKSPTVLNSDFETFLKMLTVQMQNQDPLNPMDSSEYAMQLATFSGLEQQVLTNDLLGSLIYMNSQSGLSELAGWIGLEGRSSGPAYFDGANSIEILIDPVDYADSVDLVVYNSSGREVDRRSVAAYKDVASWDGNGLGSGLYTFQVESYANGNLTEIRAAETWGRIVEARSESGAVVLVNEGGGEVFADSVTGVRQPDD